MRAKVTKEKVVDKWSRIQDLGNLGVIVGHLVAVAGRCDVNPKDKTLPDLDDPRLKVLSSMVRNWCVDNDPQKIKRHQDTCAMYELIREKGGNRTVEIVSRWLGGPAPDTLRKAINQRKRQHPQLFIFDYTATPKTLSIVTPADQWHRKYMQCGYRHGDHVAATRAQQNVPDDEPTLVHQTKDHSKAIERMCWVPATDQIAQGCQAHTADEPHVKGETKCEIGRMSPVIGTPTGPRDFRPFHIMRDHIRTSYVANNLDLGLFCTVSGFRGNNPEYISMQIGSTCMKFDHVDVIQQDELTWYWFSEHIGPRCNAIMLNFGRDGASNFFKAMAAFSLINPPRSHVPLRFRRLTPYKVVVIKAVLHVGRMVPARAAKVEGEYSIPSHVLLMTSTDIRHCLGKCTGLTYSIRREMTVGVFIIDARDFGWLFMSRDGVEHGLRKSVVRRRDPMCKKAVQDLTFKRVADSFRELAKDNGGDEAPFMGLVWYIGVLRAFYHAFFSFELTHLERAELVLHAQCSFELWRLWVENHATLRLSTNFLTKQTFDHWRMACNSMILTQTSRRDCLPNCCYCPWLDGEDQNESAFSRTAFNNHTRQADVEQFRDSQNTYNNGIFSRTENASATVNDPGRSNSDIEIHRDEPAANLDGTPRSTPRPNWKTRPLDPTDGARVWYTDADLIRVDANALLHAREDLAKLGAVLSDAMVAGLDLRQTAQYQQPTADPDSDGDESDGDGDGDDDDSWSGDTDIDGDDADIGPGDDQYRNPFGAVAGDKDTVADPNPAAALQPDTPPDLSDEDSNPDPDADVNADAGTTGGAANQAPFQCSNECVMVPNPGDPDGPGVKVHKKMVITHLLEGGHSLSDRLTRHSGKRVRAASLVDVIDSAPNNRCVKLFGAAFVCEQYDPKFDFRKGKKGRKPKCHIYVAMLRKAYHCAGPRAKPTNYGYIQPGRTANVAASFSYYNSFGAKATKDEAGTWPARLAPIDFNEDATDIRFVMRKQLAGDLRTVDLDGDNMLPVLRPVTLINSGDGYYTLPADDLKAVKDCIVGREQDPLAGL